VRSPPRKFPQSQSFHGGRLFRGKTKLTLMIGDEKRTFKLPQFSRQMAAATKKRETIRKSTSVSGQLKKLPRLVVSISQKKNAGSRTFHKQGNSQTCRGPQVGSVKLAKAGGKRAGARGGERSAVSSLATRGGVGGKRSPRDLSGVLTARLGIPPQRQRESRPEIVPIKRC